MIVEITDFYDQDASSPRQLDSGVLDLGATINTTSRASFAIDEEDLSRFSESCAYLLKIASTMKGKDRDENGNGEYQDAYFITKGGLAINVGYSENDEGEDEEPTVIVSSADQRKLLTKMPLDEVSDLSKLQQAIDKSILWLRSK